jgi:hypothetical protein
MPAPRMIEIYDPGKPTIVLFNASKTYDVLPKKLDKNRRPLIQDWEKWYQQFNFVDEKVDAGQKDDHDCVIVSTFQKKNHTPFTFYFAKNLNNLLIRVEEKWSTGLIIHRLHSISLDVADERFQIPTNYKRAKPTKKSNKS